MSEKTTSQDEVEEKVSKSKKQKSLHTDVANEKADDCKAKSSDTDEEDLQPLANITIKLEVTDEPPDYQFLNESDLMVKLENQEFISDNDARVPSPQPVQLIKAPEIRRSEFDKNLSDEDTDDDTPRTRKAKNDDDDDYQPSNSKDVEQPEQFYADDILSKVEIVQITEAQRLEEHNEALNSKKHCKFVCEHCALGFVLEGAYSMHMIWHSEVSGAHECDVCHVHLQSADRLYRHRLRHYRRYKCTPCGAIFRDRDAASAHIMTQHERRRFVCNHCGQRFKRPQYLRGHIDQYHIKKKKFECPECNKVFYERGRFRCHVRNHNTDLQAQSGPFTCRSCGEQAATKAELRRHVTSLHKPDHRCGLCGEGFRNQDTLAQHLRKAHGASDTVGYPCPHCLRTLTTRAMLNRHINRMHMDRTKKFQCDECKRYYFSKGEVRAHIMWSHLRCLGGHVCACGRVFRTPARLRDHAQRAHAELPPPRVHECANCGKTFGNKQVLNRHMKGHSNEVYPCTECNMTFKTQGYVKIHYKLKHLNMTRAEIKAQSKPFKPVMADLEQNKSIMGFVAQNIPVMSSVAQNIPVMGSVAQNVPGMDSVARKEPKVVYKDRSKSSSSARSTNDIELSVPLFETFSDIQRE